MKAKPCILIGTLVGAVAGHLIGPYHGGALLFAIGGAVLGLLVDWDILRVV